MMSAYFDSIPKTLEEAAWIDGVSRFGAFLRIVLGNSLPGILSVRSSLPCCPGMTF